MTKNSEYHGRIIVAGGCGGSVNNASIDESYKGGFGGGEVAGSAKGKSGTYGIAYGNAHANGGSYLRLPSYKKKFQDCFFFIVY